MRVTARDQKLLRDIALSHLLSRDQVIALGYFSSVTRANTRLRELQSCHFIRRIETPYFSQSLYMVGKAAVPFLGDTIGRLVLARQGSPRFLRHALAVTAVRIEHLKKGGQWRFEQQLKAVFDYAGRRFEVRPDGMWIADARLVAVEVDMGHAGPAKFAAKLRAYDAFISSGECLQQWNQQSFDVLAVTTGHRRARSLSGLAPSNPRFSYSTTTFSTLGISEIGGWS